MEYCMYTNENQQTKVTSNNLNGSPKLNAEGKKSYEKIIHVV